MHKLLLGLSLLACAVADPASSASPVVGDAAVDPVEDPAMEALEEARVDAVRVAEAFVVSRGYTDAPATAPSDALVPDVIERRMTSDQVLELRRGTLDGHAVDVLEAGGGGFLVRFRYAKSSSTGNLRAVRVAPDGSARMEHQDMIFRTIAAVARLVDTGPGTVPCGILHTGAVMTYEVVEDPGEVLPDRIAVVHGCPELSRRDYDGGGSGVSFEKGDLYRLILSEVRPAHPPSVVGEAPDLPLFWPVTTDPVPKRR